MQVQVNISFDQQLKAEIEKESQSAKSKIYLETLLLDSPIATEEQLKTIEDNKKAINQWRKKL